MQEKLEDNFLGFALEKLKLTKYTTMVFIYSTIAVIKNILCVNNANIAYYFSSQHASFCDMDV